MNEQRITDHAEHCDFYVGNEHYDKSYEEQQRLWTLKFAELIVRECVDIAKHNIYEPDYRGGSQILQSFENYQANRRAEDILNQIQKHFGVNE
jgi:hypothetical protein